MDFTLTDEQLAVRDLARGIFSRHADSMRLADIEADGCGLDTELWKALATSGVLGLVVPEEHDGAGLSLFEFALALTEQGRTLGTVPLWETVVGGALPLIRYGTKKQHAEWLPKIAAGTVFLSASLEFPGPSRPFVATATATGSDQGWTLDGTGTAVGAGHIADAVIVPAVTGDGVHLFLVRTDQGSVSCHDFRRTDRGVAADLRFVGAAAERLPGGPDEDRHDWLLRQCWIALSAIQVGMSQEAVARAAEYTSEREQFGRPLATFQAVAHQAADCHIDTEAMEVTFLNALWQETTGRDSRSAVHVARWWTSETADRVARTVQHLHGGLGADVTYPIHRYMLWTTQLANTLGSAPWHLAQLGDRLKEESR